MTPTKRICLISFDDSILPIRESAEVSVVKAALFNEPELYAKPAEIDHTGSSGLGTSPAVDFDIFSWNTQ